eukprot:COSAG01_NODE_3430_length_6105_cov_6.934565_9_plen_59_part_00
MIGVLSQPAVNGFWMDEYDKDTHQPCPAWIQTLQQGNPDQPIIWTVSAIDSSPPVCVN